jgi:hypothetical protein
MKNNAHIHWLVKYYLHHIVTLLYPVKISVIKNSDFPSLKGPELPDLVAALNYILRILHIRNKKMKTTQKSRMYNHTKKNQYLTDNYTITKNPIFYTLITQN